MPIEPLDPLDPRDFDGQDQSVGHTAGPIRPGGVGRNLASIVASTITKINEVADVVDALPLEATMLGELSELTIATGAIEIVTNYHSVDTEADAASDDLDTIDGGEVGQIIVLRPANDARTVVIKNGVGIETPNGIDITLAEDTDYAMLVRHSASKWIVIAHRVTATVVTLPALQPQSELTIATGAITITGNLHTVDTEADAASDDLDSISGGSVGQLLILRPANDARSVVVKASASIVTPYNRDITLAEDDDYVMLLKFDSDTWVVQSFKTLATSGGGLGSALAAVTTGLGASLVGIEDAATLITATTVEAALLEHQNRLHTNLIADPGNAGAIPVTRSGYCPLTVNGTRTLAIPSFAGQRLILFVDTDNGSIAITVAQAINVGGQTVITMGEARDYVELVGITVGGALRWEVAVNINAVLS